MGHRYFSFFVFFTCSAITVDLNGIAVSNETELVNAIEAINGGSVDTTIDFNNAINYTTAIPPLNAASDFSYANQPFTINGNNNQLTLTGATAFRAFFARGGSPAQTITIQNMTITSNTTGGSGGLNGGGGGGGLGGALFIDRDSQVVLDNVTFSSCSATGGASGALGPTGLAGGGGGGLGPSGTGGDSSSTATPSLVRGGVSGGGGGSLNGAGGLGPNNPAFGAGGGGGFTSGGTSGDGQPGGNVGNGGNGGGTNGGAGGVFGGPASNGNVGGGGGGGSVGPGPNGGRSDGGNGGIGGAGGGGAGGYTSSSMSGAGGDGGDFSGGGGGGCGSAVTALLSRAPGSDGGSGGFGGGGGGAGTGFNIGGNGGAGGFGGGGGGGGAANTTIGNGGLSTFGGGDGSNGTSLINGAGGGGAGFGGAIFIREGGQATIQTGITFVSNSVTGGIGGNNGQALGSDIFMMSGSTLIFDFLTQDVTLNTPIEGNQGVGEGDPTLGGLIIGSNNDPSVTVTLTGDQTYSGPTTVNSGAFVVNGSLSSPVTVNGGIFGGNNTTIRNSPSGQGSLTLSGSGMVSPGGNNLFGTLIVEGSYTQSAGANFLDIEVDSVSNTDLMTVGGSANLAGTLTVEAAVGNFMEGQEITILTADEGVIGTFDVTNLPTFDNGNPLFDVIYLPDRVALVVLTDSFFEFSVSADIEPGNPQQVVDYIRELESIDLRSELARAIQVLGLLETEPLNDALNQLQPALFGGLEWANLTQTSYVALLLANHLRTLSCSPKRCTPTKENDQTRANNFWAAPYALWIDQNNIGQLEGFRTTTTGVVVGYDRCWNRWQFGLAGGYSHTHLGWNENDGGAKDDYGYGAFYGNYTHPFFIIDLSVLGGGAFYKLTRNVNFSASSPNSTIDEEATSSPTGIFAHSRLGITGIFDRWHVPLHIGAAVDYAYLYREKFTETGAGTLNMNVTSRTTNMLRTELGLTFAPTFTREFSCISPYIGVSWLVNIPLSSSKLHAGFVGQPTALTVNATSHSVHQVMPHAGFKITSVNGFSVSLSAKAEISGQIKNYATDLKLDYCF